MPEHRQSAARVRAATDNRQVMSSYGMRADSAKTLSERRSPWRSAWRYALACYAMSRGASALMMFMRFIRCCRYVYADVALAIRRHSRAGAERD